MTSIRNLADLFERAKYVLDTLAAILIGLAFIWFLISLVKYIKAGSDEKMSTEAKKSMAFGILVLFVMVALWGLVAIVQRTIFGNVLR